MRKYRDEILLVLWFCFVLSWFGGLLWTATRRHVNAQDKKPDAATPVLADSMKLQIRDAQLDQSAMMVQLTATVDKYNELQAALGAQAKKLDELKAAALASVKLDPEKWDLDMQKLVPVQKPPKPPVAAPPEPAGGKKP